MSKRALADTDSTADVALAAAANRTRRALLSTLLERDDPVDTAELATVLAAAVSDQALVDVTRDERDRVRVGLVHNHLPRLAEAGLIEWDRAADAVAAADHAALRDRRFRRILSVDADDWDDVLAALRSEERRRILSVLEAADRPLDRTALARRVVARDLDVDPATVPERDLEDALVDLHHVQLPRLREAGLVETDGEQVRYAGHPDLDPEWLALELGGSSDSETVTAREAPDVRRIDGRADIIAHGQGLFDAADDELFLMITTDGLLEAECLRKLQAAIDRGVDAYVGSQTTAVRDLVREEVPEATIWEPQLDWLNLPPSGERLGRLVFADREAVMIGTFDGEPDGEICETALAGRGRDNSLVVLLRELLGSRLDHLDAQSADFRSQIPL